MKIAANKPGTFRTATHAGKDRLELWYSRPISVGIIEKRGALWYTEDGMRFNNNRDALEYLARVWEMRTFGKIAESAPKKEEPKPSAAKKKKGATAGGGRKIPESIISSADTQKLIQLLQRLTFSQPQKEEGGATEKDK